ncbi:hypothetical protein LEAN103870_04185 [Legionella anisa]|uniref:Uncharacterized protein n=1 Tax=Legionella anisa TaxID=28082 RepID=A0AAX0WPQ3_9GAMM|nr:hypothetical protein [Legionella anisa]AWN72939.1 hypothetical protein DLD14_03280 [Legionella anisa]KTC70605.1 hypothetical protein Lani_2152 [Legionella anisa]MBN5935116.1 hypothetical protein [Legionella anisa]MCW8423752.1 hypothetical protein [Legionella anisa]MCW8447272.1 hypothetical protein [Legionella anisa]
MNKLILTQLLNEKANPGTVCRLKSSFESLEKAQHYMDSANGVPGLIGYLLPRLINGQVKYNVQLMLYNQFDKKRFKDFIEAFEDVEIIPTSSMKEQ